jgi:hypothetical protein
MASSNMGLANFATRSSSRVASDIDVHLPKRDAYADGERRVYAFGHAAQFRYRSR